MRAGFRNWIFYAGDDGFINMPETLEEHFVSFDLSLRSLAWALGVILSGPPPQKSWGVVPQFIEVYRRVLKAYRDAQNRPTKPEEIRLSRAAIGAC
jgi:hypothetical protein